MADLQDGPITAALRALPPVQRLMEEAEASGLAAAWPRAALTGAIRAELGRLRSAVLSGGEALPSGLAAILQAVSARLVEDAAPGLRRVLNATGIVVHTNLGRAPLAGEAVAAAAEVMSGYCNLEFDLGSGRRGARGGGVEELLCALTGAEAALPVNNNAAAMLLALTALAGGGEVVVSRGELVEIGGGFRIPDIIAAGGARLVEVGTTNKTRLADYEAAITPAARILLKVHQSNFRMVGFTAEASLGELACLARARGLKLVHDLGGGALTRLPGSGRAGEPTVGDSLSAGSDVVAFSADKLLGGPQAGLLAGRADDIDRLRRHPLVRALRLDKVTLATLAATLRLHADPAIAAARIPVLRMLGQTETQLQSRAERLAGLLDGICGAEIVPSIGHAGGGALPGEAIASRAVRIAMSGHSAGSLAEALRAQRPAVAARVHDGGLLLDVLTLDDGEIGDVAGAVRGAASRAA